MTTVAFKSGIMACDSCWSHAGCVDTLSNKMVRLKSGAILGQAGNNDARPIIALLETVKNSRALPTYEVLAALRLDFLGLLVLPNRRIFKIATILTSPDHWDEDTEDIGLWEIDDHLTAIGSGAALAIGAMVAGADARKAVRIACQRDMQSRGPVHTLTL